MVYQRKHNYEYRDGWHPSVDANTVGGVMEEIEDRNGAVTSESFLEASRPEDSPTHGVYEWNYGVAAEKYRLHQAARTICAIRVIVKEGTGEDANVSPARAFVNIVEDDSRKARYMNVSDALSNHETRLAVLTRAMRELRTFQEKYASLAELAEVFSAIDSIHIRESEDDSESDEGGEA